MQGEGGGGAVLGAIAAPSGLSAANPSPSHRMGWLTRLIGGGWWWQEEWAAVYAPLRLLVGQVWCPKLHPLNHVCSCGQS